MAASTLSVVADGGVAMAGMAVDPIGALKADSRYTAASHEALQALIHARKAELVAEPSEATTLRVLLAREGDPAASFALLQSVVRFETEFGPHRDIRCPTCEVDPTSHNFLPVGWTQSRRHPIFYGCPARASNTEVDPTVHHVSGSLSHAFHQPHTSHQWVWLVDYAGFGWTHAGQGSLAVKFAKLFSGVMPERLSRILLINPPTVFRMMLAVLNPFVDARTMAKVITVSGDADAVRAQLTDAHDFPPSVADWFATTMTHYEPTPGSLPPLPPDAASLMLPHLRPHFFPATPAVASASPLVDTPAVAEEAGPHSGSRC